MQAVVYRMRRHGHAVERHWLRQHPPAAGELALRLRLLGRVPQRNIYLATLSQGDAYVIPPLENARVVEVTGRWIRIEGREIIMQRSLERQFVQEWWCRVENVRVPGLRQPSNRFK